MRTEKQTKKDLRKKRVRARISGTASIPRLSVFRGAKTLSLQLIDDVSGKTLASAYERELSKDQQKKTKTERALALGSLIAKKATSAGISKAVFDRGGNAYHGRVSAAADGARQAGLQI